MPPVINSDLSGKTVMVTGANSGIGFEAAKHFAKMNAARLIIVCRSVEKAKESIKQIEAETGYKNAEPMALDLGDFRTISESVTQAIESLDRLDILVENAAISTAHKYVQTVDGWESMLQVNSLGPALHTLLLLPLMMNTARTHQVTPRIVVVSSEVIFWSDIPAEAVAAPNTLETLSSKEFCTPEIFKNRYVQSKILNIMLVRKLAAILPKSIIPVTLNPGYCVSGLRRQHEGEEAARMKQMEDDFAYTSEEGSRQIVFSAVGGKDDGLELRGEFTSYSQVLEVSDWLLSEKGKKAEDKIWNEMLELFGKLDPRIPSIVAEYLKV
ncbi:hypothetical protein GYMLUDRAFT_165742 [Collybiopsis luxurians FD-317 M1]|uniref:NAD(P)-binding protein n=1 Tax=Collybiopsis luxurians FD-317 M1 TaxID=944289 RepID=A0A0D0C0D4_9AGAR|nr:hypothetical protein GYMLUDRAFT_165742 [Collybiopsis luxurians FD-317 M1]